MGDPSILHRGNRINCKKAEKLERKRSLSQEMEKMQGRLSYMKQLID